MTLTYDFLFFFFFNCPEFIFKILKFLWEIFQENVFIALILKIIKRINFKATWFKNIV